MTQQPDLYDWSPLVTDLEARRAAALAMGGEKQVERQRGMGKLPVRERLDLLLDPGSPKERTRARRSLALPFRATSR